MTAVVKKLLLVLGLFRVTLTPSKSGSLRTAEHGTPSSSRTLTSGDGGETGPFVKNDTVVHTKLVFIVGRYPTTALTGRCMSPCRSDYIFTLLRGGPRFGPLGPTAFA